MTDMGESIAVPGADGPWECPFDHEGAKHDKKNVLPPNEKNDSKKLGDALEENQYFDLLINAKPKKAKLAGHHIVPGNESWKKTSLHKWVDDKEGHIKADIGYDVNAAKNGVNLGDDEFFPGSGVSKQEYAYLMMAAKKRQFHDRHPAYSEWIINHLNKIAERLDAESSIRSGKGCGKDSCPLAKNAEKPYDPPYHLAGRLDGIAKRVKTYLVGSPDKWRMPLMTSRFALMYKEHVTEEEARQRLAAVRQQFKASRGG